MKGGGKKIKETLIKTQMSQALGCQQPLRILNSANLECCGKAAVEEEEAEEEE